MLRFSFAVFVLALLLTACGSVKSEKNLLVMDTVVSLKAEGEGSREAVKESAEWLRDFDKRVGMTEESEIQKLSDSNEEKYQEVSEDVYEVLRLGKEYTAFTKQAFNVTAGSLTALWDKAREIEEPPNVEAVKKAKSSVNIENLSIKVEGNNLYKVSVKSGASLTVGAIAKGYAADKVKEIYEKNKATGLINLGTSTMIATGDKTYNIGIKNPRKEGELLGVVKLKNAALSTSGDYERYFIKNGVRYHHIIDPKTGYPANNGIASATVIVPLSHENAGAVSDALSTALVVLGESGVSLLSEDMRALFVRIDGEIIKVNGFEMQ